MYCYIPLQIFNVHRYTLHSTTDIYWTATAPPPCVLCCFLFCSEVNVTRPKEYWDYESIAVQWGYACPNIFPHVCMCAAAVECLTPASRLTNSPVLFSLYQLSAHASLLLTLISSPWNHSRSAKTPWRRVTCSVCH